jgi:hypothetical protein
MVGGAPKRIVRRQWLVREHVDDGAAELAAVQCFQQIGSNEVLAATDVEQLGARLQAREGAGVQQAARGFRQRQQADQNVCFLQEHRQASLTAVDADTGQLTRLSRPAAHAEAEPVQFTSHVPTDLPEPHHADRVG